jgi:hypothetical protein
LIRKQVEHFQHVESKLSDAQRRTLPQGHIRTEHEAAEYIAAMTQLLHSKPAADAQPLPAPIVMPNRPPAPARGLEIAAASEKPAAKSPNRATPRSRKPRKGKKG